MSEREASGGIGGAEEYAKIGIRGYLRVSE
jgi:hypothetical protein